MRSWCMPCAIAAIKLHFSSTSASDNSMPCAFSFCCTALGVSPLARISIIALSVGSNAGGVFSARAPVPSLPAPLLRCALALTLFLEDLLSDFVRLHENDPVLVAGHEPPAVIAERLHGVVGGVPPLLLGGGLERRRQRSAGDEER